MHLTRALGFNHVTIHGKAFPRGGTRPRCRTKATVPARTHRLHDATRQRSCHGHESKNWVARPNYESRCAGRESNWRSRPGQRGVEKISRRAWRSGLATCSMPSDCHMEPLTRPDIVPFLFRCKLPSSCHACCCPHSTRHMARLTVYQRTASPMWSSTTAGGVAISQVKEVESTNVEQCTAIPSELVNNGFRSAPPERPGLEQSPGSSQEHFACTCLLPQLHVRG